MSFLVTQILNSIPLLYAILMSFLWEEHNNIKQ